MNKSVSIGIALKDKLYKEFYIADVDTSHLSLFEITFRIVIDWTSN
jgi:hypothetical protein